jgi:hypothetical protein
MAYGSRAPGSAQGLTATSGGIRPQGKKQVGLGQEQLTEEEKRRRRQQLQGQGQQAPWATPSSTAMSTGGGPSRNPFAGSVYSRPAQTMQGPTVATFSARPQQQQEDTLPMWRSTKVAGSSPGAPGGGVGGGMFMPAGGAGGGGGVQGPYQQFMQTIALGGPPPAPTPPRPPSMGGISLGGAGNGIPNGGFAGGMGPSGAPHPLGQLPQNAGGVMNAIQGALGGGGGSAFAPPRPPQQGGGSRPYEAPEPGDANWKPPSIPQGPQLPPMPPVASMLPPPPQMGGNTQPPPPAFTPVQPVTGTGTQFNGNAYQPQAGASGDRTPPGTVYRWGPNGYGYYPI